MSVKMIDFSSPSWHLDDVLPLHKSKREIEMCKVSLSVDGLLLVKLNNHEQLHQNDTKLGLKQKTSDNFIKAIDLLGCSWHQSPKALNFSAFLTIFAYPVMDTSRRHRRRKRYAFMLEFGTESNFQKNLDCASLWEKAIHHVLALNPLSTINSGSMDSEGKVLVLINPHSGPGKAYQIFRKQVVPVLSEAGVVYDVVITQRPNHAHDLMASLTLQQYRAIAVVAGDGLLFEVYNGLGVRPDWMTALSIPVCIVPGGSGNGLAKSLSHWRKEPDTSSNGGALVSALNLTRGAPQPMDLVMIHLHTGQRLFSFLSFGIGILSDIDIESERLRMLGETRFTVWAVAKVAALRKYTVTVSFKRAEGVEFAPIYTAQKLRPTIQRSVTLQEETYSTPPQTLTHGRSTTASGHRRTERQQHRQLKQSMSCDASMADASEDDSSDESFSVASLPDMKETGGDGIYKGADVEAPGDLSTAAVICEKRGVLREKNNNPAGTVSVESPSRGVENAIDASLNCGDSCAALPSPTRKKKTSTRKGDYSHLKHFQDNELTDYKNDEYSEHTVESCETQFNDDILKQAVPDDWETIEGEFVMVYAVYQSHISNNVMFVPQAAPDDGVIWLVLMPGTMNRANVAKFLLSMEDGQHCTVPGVQFIPVTAVRLQPHGPTGLLTVDGEAVSYGTMQAEVMPKQARVLVR